MVARWYVVQTKARLEQFAADNLRAQGFVAFYPAYRQYITRGKVSVGKTHPLYPTYIFVRFDIAEDRWRCIRGTRGVVTLVSSTEDSATAVPQGFVEDMMSNLDINGFVELEKSVEALVEYAPGTPLLVKDNAFNGLVGICKQSSAKRVTVFLTLLSRKIQVVLPLSAVQPLETSFRGNGGSVSN